MPSNTVLFENFHIFFKISIEDIKKYYKQTINQTSKKSHQKRDSNKGLWA